MNEPPHLLPGDGKPFELRPGPLLVRALAAYGDPPPLCGTTLDQYPKPRPCQAFVPALPGGPAVLCHLDLDHCRRVIDWYVARHAAREGPA